MRGFFVDENGDTDIVKMVSDRDLILQKIKSILGTNFGEWVLNRKEGINFKNIMGKNISEDAVRNEITLGLKQIGNNVSITNFSMDLSSDRKLTVKFNAKIDNIDYDIDYTY